MLEGQLQFCNMTGKTDTEKMGGGKKTLKKKKLLHFGKDAFINNVCFTEEA